MHCKYKYEKSIIYCLAIFSLTSCDDDTNLPAPYYSIEGKWIWSPSDNRADANTMYEFVDGIRYTYYCITCTGDDAYWNSLDITDFSKNIKIDNRSKIDVLLHGKY